MLQVWLGIWIALFQLGARVKLDSLKLCEGVLESPMQVQLAGVQALLDFDETVAFPMKCPDTGGESVYKVQK